MLMKHFIFLLSAISIICSDDTSQKRFEYKFSFKGPLLVHETGTVPFFEHGGHAIASEDSVRLTPSMTNKKGWMFSKKRADFGKGFEVIFSFRVTGRGRIGADGLAFWYLTDKNMMTGTTMGGPTAWNGLAVIMDTYDNDGNHDNPFIGAIVNDNSFNYDPEADGSPHIKGRCVQDFRNRPFPITVNITYYNRTLKVSSTQGLSEDAKEIQDCFSVENVELPPEGYFGFTAATGGLADDHDVYKMEVSSFRGHHDQNKPISEAEREKFEKEFAEYAESMKKAKEQYDKSNTKKHKPYQDNEEESDQARHLRQIWEGQAHIQRLIFDLMNKLDVVHVQQDKLVAHMIQNNRPSGGGDTQLPDNLARREDLHTLQESLTDRVKQIHHNVNEISSSVKNLPSHNSGGGNAYEFKQFTDDMKDQVNLLKEMMTSVDNKVGDIKAMQPRRDDNSSCPSCLSSSVFFFGIVVQIVSIIGYFMYNQRMETANKKFY